MPITSGNEVVLLPLIFNAGAERVEGLISIPEGIGREEYVHRLDRGGRDSRPGVLVGPEILNMAQYFQTLTLNIGCRSSQCKIYYFWRNFKFVVKI